MKVISTEVPPTLGGTYQLNIYLKLLTFAAPSKHSEWNGEGQIYVQYLTEEIGFLKKDSIFFKKKKKAKTPETRISG